MTWSWKYVGEFLPELLKAIPVTLEATGIACVLALALGLVIALLKRSDRLVVSGPVTLFSEFVRRTPLLVQLYFIFYVFPTFGLTLSGLVAGVLGLGINISTFTAETYRAGIDSVPQGQWEAARALDMPRWRIWRSIIIPQALPSIAAAQGTWVILLFKQSALLSTITVQELLATSAEIGSRNFNYLEPMFFVGVLYFVPSYVASVLVRLYERRIVGS